MTRRLWVACAVLPAAMLPAACGAPAPFAGTAQLPPGVFAQADQDVPAVQYAQYAFADASRTYGNPVAGAQAVLAMEYIAGELNAGARWASIPTTTQIELLQARQATREAVGIEPFAPSQLVVNSLVAVHHDLQVGDQAGAQAALANPAFTVGPAETLQRLGNLPYIRLANVATTHAAESLNGQDDAAGDNGYLTVVRLKAASI